MIANQHVILVILSSKFCQNKCKTHTWSCVTSKAKKTHHTKIIMLDVAHMFFSSCLHHDVRFVFFGSVLTHFQLANNYTRKCRKHDEREREKERAKEREKKREKYTATKKNIEAIKISHTKTNFRLQTW